MAKTGISLPIYKIDTDAAIDACSLDKSLSDSNKLKKLKKLPTALVDAYNHRKGETVYESAGSAVFSGCDFFVYRNTKAKPILTQWAGFLDHKNIDLSGATSQTQQLACFVIIDSEIYAFTSSQAAVIFERFIDISYPIAIGRRIAKPEVKGARSSQITGGTLASEVHFRDARRITHTESLQSAWTALSGQLRESVLGDKDLINIFGPKAKMRL
jgi:hypothetical protein